MDNLSRITPWCNGNTAPFGGVILGSNPSGVGSFSRAIFGAADLIESISGAIGLIDNASAAYDSYCSPRKLLRLRRRRWSAAGDWPQWHGRDLQSDELPEWSGCGPATHSIGQRK